MQHHWQGDCGLDILLHFKKLNWNKGSFYEGTMRQMFSSLFFILLYYEALVQRTRKRRFHTRKERIFACDVYIEKNWANLKKLYKQILVMCWLNVWLISELSVLSAIISLQRYLYFHELYEWFLFKAMVVSKTYFPVLPVCIFSLLKSTLRKINFST